MGSEAEISCTKRLSQHVLGRLKGETEAVRDGKECVLG